jgi:TonB family protein
MSQDLQAYLKARSHLGAAPWPLVVGASAGLHLVLAAGLWIGPKGAPAEPEVKVTWVTLPAAGGVSGGSGPMEEGEQGERLRRVEEVAPKSQEKAGLEKAPDALGLKAPKAPVKGTNPDPASTGTSPLAAKGKNPEKNPTIGAAGRGGGSGIGEGSPVPGLKTSTGTHGGTGLVGQLDGTFPFPWYLQYVQDTLTNNWGRMTSAQGRVGVYFRIRRDGRIEGLRVETSSGNGALDQSAELAVKRVNRLNPLPDGFEGDSLGVRFWFTYLGN